LQIVAPAYPRLEEYLTSIGRQKLIKPLYEELVKTPAGREQELKIYAKARPGYHPIAQPAVDKIVKKALDHKKKLLPRVESVHCIMAPVR
jgi:hypothetical protein